jgi:hypothetical protein
MKKQPKKQSKSTKRGAVQHKTKLENSYRLGVPLVREAAKYKLG